MRIAAENCREGSTDEAAMGNNSKTDSRTKIATQQFLR